MLISELFVRLSSDVTGLKKGMSSAQTSMDALKSAALKLGGVLGAAALFRGIIKNSIEAQASLAQLQAVVTSTGGAAGKTVPELQAHAQALQQVTTFGDEAIQSAQGLLLTFTKIRGDTFSNATEAVLDLAQAMGGGEGGLKAASIQVGKALNDPVAGLTALKKVGVSFSESQKGVIKNLAETGRLAEAQALILKELQVEFGGSAKAARQTLGGALQGLSNAWGDALEVSGAASSGIVGAINGIGEAIPAVRQRIDVFFTRMQELSINAAVNVERLRVGFRQMILDWATASGAPQASLDMLAQKVKDAEVGLVFMKEAAVEMLVELYKIPAPVARINTALSGLTEEAATASAAIGRTLSDWANAGGMGKANISGGAANPLAEPIREFVKVAREAKTVTAAFGDQMLDTAFRGGDAFVAFASGSKDAFSDFVKSALRDLGRLIAKMLVVEALKSALNFGAFGSGKFASGLMDALTRRASGGPVRGGQPYMVGERGPEMFVPSGSGTIIPNGGGGWAAAAAALGPLQRPMTPREAARDAWHREFIRVGLTDAMERG